MQQVRGNESMTQAVKESKGRLQPISHMFDGLEIAWRWGRHENVGQGDHWWPEWSERLGWYHKEIVNDKKIRKMSAYTNNHYAGFAPATVQLFQPLWDKGRWRWCTGVITYVWRDDSPFCPLSAAPCVAPSRTSSLLSAASWLPSYSSFAASCPPSGTGVHFLRHSCVELWPVSTMQHPRRPAVSKRQFVSFGISLWLQIRYQCVPSRPWKGSNLTALGPPTTWLHAKLSPLITRRQNVFPLLLHP